MNATPRLRLSGAAFVILGLWQAVGTGALLVPVLLYAYLAAIPLLAMLLLRDYRTVAALGPTSIEGSWSGPIELGLKGSALFRLSWQTPPRGRQRTVVWQPAPSSLVAWAKDEYVLAIPAGEAEEKVTVQFTTFRLGRERCGSSRILQSSAWGLWTRSETVPVSSDGFLQVVPSSARMPAQAFAQIMRDQAALFAGARQIQKARAPDQFHSIRRYQFPDSFRHIDQRKSARYQQLMTRTYESFHQHNLVIALDVGRTMAGRFGSSLKRDFYLAAAISLAENALRSRDRVSFFAFNDEVRVRVPPSTSMAPFHFLSANDPRLDIRQVESNYELIGRGLQDLGAQRSIVVLLTDAARPPIQAALANTAAGICRKHLTIVLSLIDRSFDVDEVALAANDQPLDELARAELLYAYWLQHEFALFRKVFGRMGGGVACAHPDHWLDLVNRLYGVLRLSGRA